MRYFHLKSLCWKSAKLCSTVSRNDDKSRYCICIRAPSIRMMNKHFLRMFELWRISCLPELWWWSSIATFVSSGSFKRSLADRDLGRISFPRIWKLKQKLNSNFNFSNTVGVWKPDLFVWYSDRSFAFGFQTPYSPKCLKTQPTSLDCFVVCIIIIKLHI